MSRNDTDENNIDDTVSVAERNELDIASRETNPLESVSEGDEPKSEPADRAQTGPFDLSEVPAIRPYVDLGSLKVLPREGLQIRLDVEEGSKRIVAVSLDIAESTLQVQAFSAPKSSGVWMSILRQISSQLEQQGAVPASQEGAFGPEIVVSSQTTGPLQMRFIGVDGPRWVLRGTVSGRALHDPVSQDAVEQLFRSLVVVRGDLPMPPRELLPLRVPPTVTVQ